MNLHKVASEIFRFYIWKVNSKRKSPPLEICLFLYEKGYLTQDVDLFTNNRNRSHWFR